MNNNGLSCVYIIIVNWNGWSDTIECLESLYHLQFNNFRIIVCDNASNDHSLEYLSAWANGNLNIYIPVTNPLRKLSFPPIAKPISYSIICKEEAELQKHFDFSATNLIFIQTNANLGFAGGNNVGLRFVLNQNDSKYVWLLNNDTVVLPDALTHLVNRMNNKTKAGMCGSTLLYYDCPSKVQALGGGIYNKWIGSSKHIGLLQNASDVCREENIESQMNYVVGASMLISNELLRSVGLMNEEYFLYMEEIDWAVRSKDCFTLAYASKSNIYHKGGSTINANTRPNEASLTSDYYIVKNRIIVTLNHFIYALPTVYLGLFVAIINRVKRKQLKRVIMIIKLMIRLGKY